MQEIGGKEKKKRVRVGMVMGVKMGGGWRMEGRKPVM